jgi:hypothetical protein
MKASELRIGNYVMVENELLPNYKNQPLIITSIQQRNDRDFPNSKSVISCDVDKYNSVSQFDEFIRPIPLTEEWLLKFGFKKCENGWKTLSICNDWTYLSWERLVGIELSVNKHSCMLPNIKYVHQLQNLFFALTGEELIIKN